MLMKSKVEGHTANFTKDLADVIARINWLVEESSAHNTDSSIYMDESDFLNSVGGSQDFKNKILKNVFNVHSKSGPQASNQVFFRGGSTAD